MKGKIKLDKKIKALPQKKKQKKLLFIAIICIILVTDIILTICNYMFPYVPEFFPLNNPKGSYTITKGCNMNEYLQEQGGVGNFSKYAYCVEYRGGDIMSFTHAPKTKTRFYSITVGKSTQDLQPFLNKEVLITSGKFVNSDKQCVGSHRCIPFGSYPIVLDVYSMEAK